MSVQTWVETLVSAQVDGPTLTNTTTLTSITPAQAKATLPGSWCAIGRTLRLRAVGRISTTSSNQTISFNLVFGGTTIPWGGSVLIASGLVNKTFVLDVLLTCRTIGNGTNATFMGIGTYIASGVIGVIPDTAPAVGAGFDSTVPQTVDLQLAWTTTASTGNSVTLHEYTLESMN